jgi:nucleoside-diphosphate-sugar epimerase
MKNKNVLITGGAGFFGSKLTEKFLDKGYSVTVYDSLLFGDDGIKPFLLNENYKFVNGCVTDFNLLESVASNNDIIVNLAAYVGEPICKANKDTVYKINTDAAIFLSKFCNDNSKQFLFLSTCSNYGKNDLMVDETSELNPLGLYSDSKIKAENYIIENVKSYLILRCATLFGVSHRMRVDLTINQFLYEINKDGFVSVYGEEAWRPYLHVEDACNMIIMSLEQNLNGVYNLGDKSLNYTKKQIVDELLKYKQFKVEQVDWDDPRDYKVDFSKLRNIIDYEIKFDLKSGIDELNSYLLTDDFKNKISIKNA